MTFPSRLQAQAVQSDCESWMLLALSLRTMGQGVAWLKSHGTESLEGCPWQVSKNSSYTETLCDPTLPKQTSCRATNCVKNVRRQTKAFQIWGITVDLSRSWSERMVGLNKFSSPGTWSLMKTCSVSLISKELQCLRRRGCSAFNRTQRVLIFNLCYIWCSLKFIDKL